MLFVAETLSGADLGVDFGFADIVFATIDGREVIYAFARIDNRVVEITISQTGALSVVGGVDLTGSVLVGRTPDIEVTGSQSALVIAGYDPTNGSAVSLSESGTLGVQTIVEGADSLNSPAFFELSGDHLVLSASAAGGVDLLRETSDGLVDVSGLPDSGNTPLSEVSDLLILSTESSGARVLAASSGDNALTLIDIASDGGMSVAGTLGPDDGFSVSGTLQLDLIETLGGTYAAVASSGAASLSLVEIVPDGSLRLTDHILDSNSTRFADVSQIATAQVGDFAYMVAGGSEGGVSLFTALPGGQMVHLASFEDTETTALNRISGLEMSVSPGTLNIYGASAWEAGLTRLTYDVSALGAVLIASPSNASLAGTGLDDQIIGSASSESLDGLAGDDIIYDGAGSDTLTGGNGADLFIFEADGVADTVMDFEFGVDRLDLSNFDFLYRVEDLEILPTATGATLTFRNEVVHITSTTLTPLSEADFTDADILNVDRPPQITMARSLQGGPLDDLLHGAEGLDTIMGGEGADQIFGNGGDDFLRGEGGTDRIAGGTGNDWIEGGGDADTLVGGEGDDVIDGGKGGDVIYGDEELWTDIA